jgi:tetratricopeptide (TPR) repeat protein
LTSARILAVADSSYITDLEGRITRDPASIAFAQLAEEYRRAGRFEDAVQVCRTGLARHPEYPSARLTLGRALVALGQLDDAREEFERVIWEAADNLAALRAMDELRHMGITSPTESTGRALSELEHWLAAIAADRVARRANHESGTARQSE